jgi:hypothetical protein
MAPTQESGLRENCTSRLSERAEGGRKPHLSRLYSWEADEQSRATGPRTGGAKGGGQGECEPATHALDSEPGKRVTRAGAHTASRNEKRFAVAAIPVDLASRAYSTVSGTSPPCFPAFGTRFGTHHDTHALRPFVGGGRGSCLWTQARARKLPQVFRRQLPFLALGREFNECPM